MATDSNWGFVGATLTGESSSGNSSWGFTSTELVGPVQPAGSQFGLVQTRLRQAPKPVAVLTESGLAYSPILVFDGTSWK